MDCRCRVAPETDHNIPAGNPSPRGWISRGRSNEPSYVWLASRAKPVVWRLLGVLLLAQIVLFQIVVLQIFLIQIFLIQIFLIQIFLI